MTLYISVFTLATFVFFLSHWVLCADEDDKCGKISPPMYSLEWEGVGCVIMIKLHVL